MGLYQRKGIWFLDYYAVGRRIRESTGSTSKEFAKRALKARRGDVARGKFGFGKTHTMNVLAERFLEHCKNRLRSETLDSYGYYVETILKTFSGRTLDTIKRREIEQWMDGIHKGRKPATYELARNKLK